MVVVSALGGKNVSWPQLEFYKWVLRAIWYLLHVNLEIASYQDSSQHSSQISSQEVDGTLKPSHEKYFERFSSQRFYGDVGGAGVYAFPHASQPSTERKSPGHITDTTSKVNPSGIEISG